MRTRYSAVGNSIHSRNNFCRGIGFERMRSVSDHDPRFLESDVGRIWD